MLNWALSQDITLSPRQGYSHPCNISCPNTLLTAGRPVPFLVGVLQVPERRQVWIAQDTEEAGFLVAVYSPARPLPSTIPVCAYGSLRSSSRCALSVLDISV